MPERLPNQEQQKVIDELEQNIILFASAGTGKTFSVAKRVDHIIRSGAAEPEDVLCLTFTVKACREMKDDILQYAGEAGKGVTVSTIHSFCYQILREESKRTKAVYSEPEVYDEVDADAVLKDALAACGFENGDVSESKGVLYPIMCLLKKEREMNGPYTVDEAYDFQTVLNRLVSDPDDSGIREKIHFFHKSQNEYRDNLPLYDFLMKNTGEWARCYCDMLRKANALDFEDLICFVHRAVKSPEFRQRMASRFRYVIVDEMQDTSVMEYDIIRCLLPEGNAMMCGDYFQTIYEWRGTDPDTVFRRYTEEFHPVRITFARNYRSTRRLCAASFGYLKNAFPEEISRYIPVSINIESEKEGEKILHIRTTDRRQEAHLITEYLRKYKPEDPAKFCIMSRTNREIAELFRALQAEKAEHEHEYRFFTVDEEKRFSCKAVIKDVLAIPRILLSGRTDEMSFLRVSKTRIAKGVGDAAREKIRQSGEAGLSLSSFLRHETYTDGDPYAPLMRAFQENNIVVYDTETTGLDTGKDQIIQIAAIRLDASGNPAGKMDCLVRPTVPISKGALATHHKTEEEIGEYGTDALTALSEFSRFADGAVIVGHNSVRFDFPLIQRQMKECGLPPLNIRGHYDTMLMAKQFLPRSKNYKLATLNSRFGIVNENAHDAYGDIVATGTLLYRLVRDYIIPKAAERRQTVEKYRSVFEPVKRELDILESDFLNKGDISGMLDRIIHLYGYEHRERESDREALNELKDFMQDLSGSEGITELREFLNNLNLSGSQMDVLIRKMKKIPIITVHQSKGCEFDTVIIADATDHHFPSQKSVQEGRETEERRLFYVAISRAREKLIIISPLRNHFYKESTDSRYIRYIPDEYMETKSYGL